MPSADATPPGAAYSVLLATYLTVSVIGPGAVGLAVQGTTLRTGAVIVLLGGLAILALVGSAVGLLGIPNSLRPRRLYASGWSWLPGSVGVVALAAAFPVGTERSGSAQHCSSRRRGASSEALGG